MDSLDSNKQPRILLADDSVTIRKVIELTFKDEGIHVTSVADGDEAMRSFVENQPDLVIADVNMPGISGYTLCEMIKLDETTRDVPVVLLTGSFEPFDAGEASRVGANYYFTKPFASVRDVVEKVLDLLDTRAFDHAIVSDTTDIDSLYVESIYTEDDAPVELAEVGATSEDSDLETIDDLQETSMLTDPFDDTEDFPELDAIESTPPAPVVEVLHDDTAEFERVVDDEPFVGQIDEPEIETVKIDADIEYLTRAADLADAGNASASFERIYDDIDLDDELIEEFHPNAPQEDTRPVVITPAANSIDPFAEPAAESPAAASRADSTLIKFEIDEVEQPKPEAAYSPELVDAIVDRLMERLSDKAVREAAQEAVPRIAEKLIREALDTETNS
ncbi:MAG: response regulator [Blastocatellia bacterium]|nr:response regulator [Blastocatellia bacterium]